MTDLSDAQSGEMVPAKLTFNSLGEAVQQLNKERAELLQLFGLYNMHVKEIIEQLTDHLEKSTQEVVSSNAAIRHGRK